MAHLEDSQSVLRHLNLTPDRVREQAEFFASYAQMLERQRPTDARGDVWGRVANPGPQWLGSATLASTYRLAAQYAALVDMRRAAELAIRAALAYLDAGLPFGLFLVVGLLDDELLRDGFVLPTLRSLLSEGSTDPALADPVQQAYLLLTAASRPWLQDNLRGTLDAIVRNLDAHDLQPIGPQSIPLVMYLNLARTMLSNELGDTEVRTVGDQLAAMGRTQAASLRSAMRNQYLWEHGAAPVNVVDFEYVAMYGLAMRHRPGWTAELYRHTTEALANDDALAELPAWTMERLNGELPEIANEIRELLSRRRRYRTEDF